MNGSCNTCPVESDCGYEYKPTDCCDQRKLKDKQIIGKLWAIYLSGMDEYEPAPSEEAAHQMAAKHNAAMDEYYAKNPDTTGYRPTRESVSAIVEEWPFGPEDHAIDLEDFDYQAWGIEK